MMNNIRTKYLKKKNHIHYRFRIKIFKVQHYALLATVSTFDKLLDPLYVFPYTYI